MPQVLSIIGEYALIGYDGQRKNLCRVILCDDDLNIIRDLHIRQDDTVYTSSFSSESKIKQNCKKFLILKL